MNELAIFDLVMKGGALVLVAWAWFQAPRIADKFEAAMQRQAIEFTAAIKEQRQEFRQELAEFRTELRGLREALDRQADLIDDMRAAWVNARAGGKDRN